MSDPVVERHFHRFEESLELDEGMYTESNCDLQCVKIKIIEHLINQVKVAQWPD